MSYIPVMIQGILIMCMAEQAFPDHTWQYWAAIVANAVLTAVYGEICRIEGK